jgi:hypothetical protein
MDEYLKVDEWKECGGGGWGVGIGLRVGVWYGMMGNWFLG